MAKSRGFPESGDRTPGRPKPWKNAWSRHHESDEVPRAIVREAESQRLTQEEFLKKVVANPGKNDSPDRSR